jgi:CubicO group peptidase (beta-lactamase class C family)
MTMTLMHGFPPAPAGQVTLANWRTPPFNQWALHHVREVVPSAEIANDPENIWQLALGEADLSGLGIEAALASTATDAMVVLHHGRIVFEQYANGMARNTPHILMSVSKSVLGVVAGILAAQGRLDTAAPVTSLIPEVAGSAYDGATLGQLLDMRAGIAFEENYEAVSGAIIEYRKAQGWNPLAPGETASDLRSFFPVLRDGDGPHGGRFHYVSPNTDLLGWALERASGTRYADLTSQLLWAPMGAQRDAYITVDRLGAPRCAGGVCATARDLARLGQLIAQGGAREGRQIVPEAWIADITGNGDAGAWDRGDFAHLFPGAAMHYRDKWYVTREATPMLSGLGVNGQHLFVDRARQLVIAKFSSQASALDVPAIEATMAMVARIRGRLG